MRLREPLADEIRAAMARRRVTQRQLALALGISQGSMSARLRGGKPFTTDQLFAVAEFLDVDAEQLLASARASVGAA